MESGRGRAILVYRDLPPAIVRAPGWFEDSRFAFYAELITRKERNYSHLISDVR